MKLTGLFIIGVVLFFHAAPAGAISLEEAKKKGLVGETRSGYLEPVDEAPEVKSLANEINSKRKKAYRDIAQKNNSPVEVVEEIGGKEAIENAPPGTYVKVPGKGWLRK